MTKLWHCTPEEYERQTVYSIALGKAIWNEEQRAKDLEEKRQDIRSRAKHGK